MRRDRRCHQAVTLTRDSYRYFFCHQLMDVRTMIAVPTRGLAWMHRYFDWELLVALRVNRLHRLPAVRAVFALASRLGDGWGWYAIMLGVLAAHGWSAAPAVMQMLITGFTGTLLYWWLKRSTARARPCDVADGLSVSVAPLDRYSFPSGHTLHAVSFSVLLLQYDWHLAWVVVPFAALVIASRMVLGLHYLSDVLVGAAVGASLAAVSLWWVHF